MKILLVGHEGYLGRGLYSFLARKHQVLGWDKKEDLFNLDGKILARENIALVINLALIADRNSKTFIMDAPGDSITVGGARHLAKTLRGTEIPWLQMSTREVFGPVLTPDDVIKTESGYRPKKWVNESCPYAPTNFYGKSKLVAEFIAESHPQTNIIRLSTCYTDFDHPAGNWVVNLIKNSIQGKPVTLTQGGLQYRDPLHTDDLATLILQIHEKKIFGEAFNTGGGEKNLISLLEFVKTANPNVEVKEASGGDVGFSFDISKAERLTGWKPEVLIRKKIPVIVENIRKGIIQPAAA